MHLAPITPENYEAALAITVRPDQQDLVAPVARSLAEAYVYAGRAQPYLIHDDDRPVGFVMTFHDLPWGGDPGDLRSGLWRLNIAAGEQGHGYGRYAVETVCARLRDQGLSTAYVTYEPRDGGPAPFYRKLGFRPTGEFSDGEVVAARPLT